MLEKAHALKEQRNLEVPKGIKPIPSFSNKVLLEIADNIGIDVGVDSDSVSLKA